MGEILKEAEQILQVRIWQAVVLLQYCQLHIMGKEATHTVMEIFSGWSPNKEQSSSFDFQEEQIFQCSNGLTT